MSGSRRRQKLFTLEEARGLVPRLREMIVAIQLERQELAGELRRLGRLTPTMRSNGYRAEAELLEERIGELRRGLRQKVRQLLTLGIEVKDIDAGLIDFPSLREGRVVYLCWRADEPTVEYWHERDAGFAGRRPLDDGPVRP